MSDVNAVPRRLTLADFKRNIRRHSQENPHSSSAPADDETVNARPGVRVFNDVEFCRLPDPRWDIDGVTQQGGLEIGFGPSDAGKSTLYAGRACCLATGTDWLGMKVVREPVYAVVFEGRHAFRKKIRAWKALHGFDVDHVIGVHVDVEPVNFLNRTSVLELLKRVERLGAGELIVDTLAQSTGADEENAPMQIAVNHAELIRRHTGARVVFIHHSGKNRKNGARGGSALTAAADTVLSLDREKDGHVLRCVRQRDGERFSPIALTLTHVGSTVLFERADVPLAGDTTRLHCDLLAWLRSNPGAVTDAVSRGVGKRKTDVMAALQALVASGQLTSAKKGHGTAWSVIS